MWKEFGKIGKAISPHFAKLEDVRRLSRFCSSGRIYEHFCAKTGWDRASTKVGTLKFVLGAKGRYPKNALQNAFVREFPNVWRFIRKVNSESNATLFQILQRVESTLFVVLVGEILMKTGIPALTLHDGIVCRKRDIGIVQDVIHKALGGFPMELNPPEDWG